MLDNLKFHFILRSKYLTDIIIDGKLVFEEYSEYTYDTREYSNFYDLEEYRVFLIDNMGEFKYDIIDFMENNYFIEEFIDVHEYPIFNDLHIPLNRFVDTIIEINVRCTIIY